jgi:hypothetical protein
MKRNILGKDYISINIIGKQRFWFGITTGIFSAIIISLLFNYTRETMRMFTALNTDMLIPTFKEFRFYNYFFSALASTFGLSITIWIWLSNSRRKRKKDRIYKQLGQVNAFLILWTVLMMITRIGTILIFVLYGTEGYDNHLNFYEDFSILLILLPIVIFAQNWFTVRLIYKSTKWIFYSLLICILLTITLANTTVINQEKLNNGYLSQFKEDFSYIENEMDKAKVNYQIVFDNKTIETLKKWKTESSLIQVSKVKNAFKTSSKVSLDTIILQKIIFHNFKIGDWYYSRRSIENWQYALPYDLYRQIKKNHPDSPETKELIKIIKEQIELINLPKKDWNTNQRFTPTEWRKKIFINYNLSPLLVSQLKSIRDSIIRDSNLIEYKLILPEIKSEKNNNMP